MATFKLVECGRCKGMGLMPVWNDCMMGDSAQFDYKRNAEKAEWADCDHAAHGFFAIGVVAPILIGTLCCFGLACQPTKCSVCNGKGKLKFNENTGEHIICY